MKIAVIGLGSMGKRRLRLLRDFFEGNELCGVDSNPERREEAEKTFGIPTYENIDKLIDKHQPDAAFVCTAPLAHAKIIEELLEFGVSVFSEINLVDDGYDLNVWLADKKGVALFLSSTPMYRKETQYIEKAVGEAQCPVSYTYHVGQYLPDWHPWESYKNFFVGDKRTNGCRELLAIELPWLESAFGKITETSARRITLGSLGLDYPDTYFVTLTHENGTVGQLMIDIVSRKAERELTVIGEKLFLKWGGTPTTLSYYDFEAKADVAVDTYESVNSDPRYADNIIENAYVDEMKAFFELLAGKTPRMHSFADDARVLSIIDDIEED